MTGEPSAVAAERGVEQRLLITLAAWATWSLGVGAVMWRLGRVDGAPTLAGAGRATVAWALGDAAAVAWGGRRAVRSRGGAFRVGRARRLAVLTGANALLDVGWVAAGATLATAPRRRGEGLATAVQGAFLVYLDTRYALEFAVLARDASAGTGPRPLDSPRARDRRRPARGGGAGPGGNDSVVVRTVS